MSMKSMPSPRLAIDLDKVGSPVDSNSTRCDFMVVAHDILNNICYFLPVELKGESWKASQVVRQLQASSSDAERLISEEDQIRFIPVLTQKSTHPMERQKLRESSNRIRFHRHEEPVQIRRCGDQLSRVLVK
ncbi:MAG: hypothetical protein OXG88_07545 [Gammaproteobacteria bacterium]|nr:hypothetical protein [Gammaproteobacteria bacterium]